MKKLSLVLLAFTILGGGAGIGAQRPPIVGPPMPFEDVGACPFECCTYRDWVANGRVTARTERRAGAPIAFTLGKGDRVQAMTGVVVIVKPGRVQFRKAVDIGASAGSVNSTLHIEPGDTLYTMTNRGEGEIAAWFKGRYYDSVDGSEFLSSDCEDEPAACNAMVREKPQTVWWVRLRTSNGLEGWTNEADKFDNKDACS